MIESFIIALREGIEIALVLGILIVYLRKIQYHHLISSVYSGLAAALVVSIAGAIVLQKLAIDQEVFEGYLMLTAAVFVLTMIVWMWMTSKKIKAEIQEKVDLIVQKSSGWNAKLGIFLFTFLMIVREGVETVIFLQAIAVSTEAWQGFFGTTLGLSTATIFAFLFIRGSLKIDIARFLQVTAIALVIFTFQLIVNAFHEFYEFGVFPANPKAMAILGPIVQNNTLFIIAIISIPALMMIIPGRKKLQTEDSGPPQRRWQLSAGIASICIVFFLGMGDVFSSNHEMDLSSQFISVPENGVITVPLSDVGDGNVHRYSIRDNGLEIRFFVLRTGMGEFATAFDACYACYSYGKYFLRNGELICSLCDAPSAISSLRPALQPEEPTDESAATMDENGCAPIYLPSKVREGGIEITLADLQKRRKYFDITQEE